MDSAKHSPASIVPQRGQVSENTSQPSKSEHWGVFHDDEAWSHLANDSGHLAPKPAALPVNARPFACNADVLAGKPARYHVNNSAPRAAVKCAHVGPNRENVEASVVLSLCQNGCGVGITFNGADAPPPEEPSPENSATSACEKSQLI
jgi:hypothetical protein